MITGIKEIDKYIEHDRRNKILALAGRPLMGRTALAIDMIANYSEENERVVYFSTQEYKWDAMRILPFASDCQGHTERVSGFHFRNRTKAKYAA